MTKVVSNLDKLGAIGINDSGITSINGGALSGFRNRLQNPLFQVDIQGNAGGVTTTNAHVVEGWANSFINDVTTQTTSRVAGDSVPYAIRYAVTTGSDSSIGSTQYSLIQTAIEGYDFADALWGTANAKNVWLSGRIKAPTTGVYCICARNGAGNRRYVFEVACTAGTWVDFEKEIPGDTSGTWEKTNGVGLILFFVIAGGSDYYTTADTWTASTVLTTANQANGLASNGNIYEIEDIRVSVGGPIPTEYRPYALDLAHCKRYFRYFYISYYNGSSDSKGIGGNVEPNMRVSPTVGTRVNWLTSGEAGSVIVANNINLYITNPSNTGVGGQFTLSARMI